MDPIPIPIFQTPEVGLFIVVVVLGVGPQSNPETTQGKSITKFLIYKFPRFLLYNHKIVYRLTCTKSVVKF